MAWRKHITWPVKLLLLLLPLLVVRAALEVDAGGDDPPAKTTIRVPDPKDAGKGEGSTADPYASILVFKNGDRLHGQLRSLNEQGIMTWARPDMSEPIQFAIDNLYGIKMERARPPEEAKHQTLIYLTNGDAVIGDILALDATQLTLRTWYGGDISIKRQMIAAIHPPGERNAPLLYEGPTDMSEWRTVNGEWQVRHGELVGVGEVGANLKLPNMARFRFEVNWPVRRSSFSLSMYVKDLTKVNLDTYRLSFGSNNVALYRQMANAGLLNLGQVQAPYLMSRGKAWFEILVNKETSTFALLVNDKLIKKWNDPQGFAGTGTGIVFMCHDRSAPISVSDITVSQWDGNLGNIGAVTADDLDVVQFANFDRITGTVKSISDNKLSMQTPYAVMDIPLSRIQTLAMAQDVSQRARRYDRDVELYFADGNKLTLRLQAIKDGQAAGYSENFGEVRLNMEAFHGMKLNVYDTDLPAEEESQLFEQGNFQGFVSDW